MTQRLSQEDINRRHMQAMGIDPDLLGKPYSTPQPSLTDAMRCTVVYDGFRCARLAGHPGRHVRGSLKWGNEDESATDQKEDEST